MSVSTKTILACDHCGLTTETLDPLYPSLWPQGWRRMEAGRGFVYPGDRVFCSVGCLVEWVQEEHLGVAERTSAP